MTVGELIELLEDFDPHAQVFVNTRNLHDPVLSEYEMDDLPPILVIS